MEKYATDVEVRSLLSLAGDQNSIDSLPDPPSTCLSERTKCCGGSTLAYETSCVPMVCNNIIYNIKQLGMGPGDIAKLM